MLYVLCEASGFVLTILGFALVIGLGIIAVIIILPGAIVLVSGIYISNKAKRQDILEA